MEELKKKIDEAIKCQFVVEVIFTEDELAKIYDRANSLLRNYDYGYARTKAPRYKNCI